VIPVEVFVLGKCAKSEMIKKHLLTSALVSTVFASSVLSVATLLLSYSPLFAQSPTGTATPSVPSSSDSVIIFESPRPLFESKEMTSAQLNNVWGLSAFFSDYGFGGGAFIQHKFGEDLSALVSVDFGTAKGPNEYAFIDEIKINDIFVIPLVLSLQYRILDDLLSENLRPYLTAGAGGVFVMTTPSTDNFFPSFGSAKIKVVPGGFAGLGANFGIDRHSTFGANLRYYFIPYPPPGVESTANTFLTNFNGMFLTVNYGFNF